MEEGSQALMGNMAADSDGGVWSQAKDTLIISSNSADGWALGDYDLSVRARDMATNTVDELKLNYKVVLNVESDPPIIVISPIKLEHNTTFDVSFTCDDGLGSGCAKIWYTTDNGEPGAGDFFDLLLNPNPSISIQNSLTLKYKSEDQLGNLGATQSIDYLIENQAPETTVTPQSTDGPFNTSLTISLSCNDLPTIANSGCDNITYSINNDPIQIFSPSTTSPILTINLDSTAILTYFSSDKAGNTEQIATQTFVIDIIPPSYTVIPLSDSILYEISQIIIIFDEDMDTNPLALTLSGDMSLESDIGIWSSGINSINNILTLNPSTSWTAGVGKTLSLTASDIAGNNVSTGTLTYNILKSALNDTGITHCSNADTIGLVCNEPGDGTGIGISGGTMLYPGQDAEYGRDILSANGQLPKIGDGSNGFDFTKLDNLGNPLNNQYTNYTTTPWYCVRDNVTGLVWEVKTPSGSGDLRDASSTFTWYNSNSLTNGGGEGTVSGGSCLNAGRCDTEKYVEDINAIQICGYVGWRLPKLDELRSIINYSIPSPGPAIDTNYFPNFTPNSGYYFWSSSPHGISNNTAWIVFFNEGTDINLSKSTAGSIRLVHDGL